MAKGAITVKIDGQYDDKDINKAIRDLNALKTQSGAATGIMGGLSKSALGVGAALGAAFGASQIIGTTVDFLKDAAGAAIEDQKSVVALAKAMDNLGLSASLPGVETGIKKLMLMTGVADDQLRPAFQKLVTATGDVAQSQKLLQLSLDISAATGKDLSAVTQSMARASLGQVSALTRLGIPLDASIIKSKDFAAAQEVLTQKFGGQAAAAAETYAGKIQRLNTAVGEAKETIGYALVGALDSMATEMGGTNGAIDVVTRLGDRIAEDITGFGELGKAVAALAPDMKTTDGQTSETADGFTRLGGSLLALATGPFGIIASTVNNVEYAFGKVGEKVGQTKEQLTGLAESASAVDVTLPSANRALFDTSKAAADAAVSADDLAQSFKDLQATLSNQSAIIKWHEDLTGIRGDLDKTSRSLDLNTAAGQKNQTAIVQMFDDAAKAAQAWGEKTGRLDEVPRKYQELVDKSRRALVANGIDGKDLDKFLGELGIYTTPMKKRMDGVKAVGIAAATTAATAIGSALSAGIPAGMGKNQDKINAMAREMIKEAEAEAKRQAEINSPSKVFERIGAALAEGTAKGVTDNIKEATKASADMIGQVIAAAVKKSHDDIDSAYSAIKSTASSITGQVLGNVNFQTTGTDAEGKSVPLTPEQIVAMMFGTIAAQHDAVSQVAANIGTALPPELLSQVLSMPPDVAVALAQYLGSNPALLQSLSSEYDALGIFTNEALGLPMGLAWAKVGDQSAKEMLAAARALIKERKDTFSEWVANQLSTTISVGVNFVGSGLSGARANGGPVDRGGMYLVGENGPEIFAPSASGSIIPNGGLSAPAAASGGGNSYSITVQAGVGDPRQIGQQVVEVIRKFEKANGPVWTAA